MRPTAWNDQHEELLAAADPDVIVPTDVDLDRVWNRVASQVGPEEAQPRRRRGRLMVGAGIVAVAVGTSAAATAGLFSAHTGQGPTDREDRRLGGPGERLDMAAPDLGEVIAKETSDIPFPSDAAREVSLRQQIHDNTSDAGPGEEFVSTGAIRAWVAADAVCAWTNQWAAATRDRDAAARGAAIAAIQAAPDWSAVTDIDPAPYSRWKTMDLTDSSGHTSTERYRDHSQFFYLGPLGDAVEGADLDAAAAVLIDNGTGCRPDLVPELPQADPLRGGR